MTDKTIARLEHAVAGIHDGSPIMSLSFCIALIALISRMAVWHSCI